MSIAAAIPAALGNVVSGFFSGRASEKNAERNIKLQKDFAQQGIRWKVADAKAAGLHPLAALGAQTSSFSPVSIGSDNVGTGLAAAGQDISRAINATRSTGERVDAYTSTIQDLNVKRMGLENELLASQIAKINQAGTPPAMPGTTDKYLMEGQGNSPLVDNNPLSRVVGAPGAGSQEPGAITDLGYTRTPTGYFPVMSKDAKERLEEDWIGGLMWGARNRLSPTIGGAGNPPQTSPGDNRMWIYNWKAQEYQSVPIPYAPRGSYGGFTR